ncbi:hypothetical protein TWF225_005539 [Orbilia oligospora]|uniref:Uncharacterized protein n=1 Tax=Orbilia oligospora TaxID=2813651 RepID=A0A7C8KHX8_ORBOL|nr:hypothetical protein TWF751_005446 [Orbilia oligospora]KAF3194922.1 hypothetical protein TWF225_005539 [Orbilia oligospora]KAF3259826.1 hypothetical protein TWF128_003822 [Orbilia oligospora]KAF3270863.1 hypothetical protein TWF217_007137 [Orbilia oligospora]KAF3292347.1 hypothetical protein TWF132_005737 [Orbilia oligospora]
MPMTPSTSLPLELQFQILKAADFTDLPTLSRVCTTWRDYLLQSPAIISNRYTYYPYPETPRPVYFHKLLYHLSHFIRFEDGGELYPCHVEFNDIKEEEGEEGVIYIDVNEDWTEMTMADLLKDVPVTKLEYGVFGNDVSFISAASASPAVISHIEKQVPSELLYLDIGHPSVLWNLMPFDNPDAAVSTSLADTLEGEDGDGDENEDEDEDEDEESEGGEQRGPIRGALKLLTQRANMRYDARPLNGSDAVTVVKVVPELHEYLDIEFPANLEIGFASMPEERRMFKPGRVERIVRLMV